MKRPPESASIVTPAIAAAAGWPGRHLEDRGAELDRLGLRRQVGEHADRVGAVGLRRPDRVVAGALGGLDDLDGLVALGADPPVAEVESELQRHRPRKPRWTRDLVLSGDEVRPGIEPIKAEMTKEQMIHRAERAEQLHRRLAEVEHEREATGLYEERPRGEAAAPRARGGGPLLALTRERRHPLARARFRPARFGINPRVSDERHPGGLSGKEAAKRLRAARARRRTVPAARSRASSPATSSPSSTRSSGSFFIVILSLGLFADALFGFIAILNSYIGIRQEIKAKETLESLALLVAPKAKAVRDGNVARGARRRGRARRLDPGRARRPAGRRRRGDREPWPDPRRVDAHRRGRRGAQAGRPAGALGVVRASPDRATTRSTRSARTPTPRRSRARPAPSATPPPRCRRR